MTQTEENSNNQSRHISIGKDEKHQIVVGFVFIFKGAEVDRVQYRLMKERATLWLWKEARKRLNVTDATVEKVRQSMWSV